MRKPHAYPNDSQITRRLYFFLFLFLFIVSGSAQAQISGASSVCVNDTTTLTGLPTGGTWSSSATGIATINSSTGLVTGVLGGTVTITYTTGGTHITTSLTVNSLPTVYAVNGGGSYCSGGLGLHVGLFSSSAGVNYQLYDGTTAVGSPLSGIGGALDFGPQTPAEHIRLLPQTPLRVAAGRCLARRP